MMRRLLTSFLALLLVAVGTFAQDDDGLVVEITARVRYSLRWGGVEQDTYTKDVIGEAPLKVGFDAPKYYYGAATASERPDSVVAYSDTLIDVAYDYALQPGVLPFEPAELQNGSFGAGTKWYYLCPTKTTTYAYTDGAAYAFEKNILTDPADTRYFFTFTGNPLSGYQLRTYDDGPSRGAMVADESAPDAVKVAAAASTFMVEAGSEAGQCRFRLPAYDATGQSYLNAYSSPLNMYSYSWESGYAAYTATDENSQFYVHEVSAALMNYACEGQMAIAATIPAVGVVSELSEIHILFDQPIHRLYGYDHAGDALTDETDEKTLTLTNQAGEVVRQFRYDDLACGYIIDPDNAYQLNLTMEEPLTALGRYVLTLPEGFVYAEDGTSNAEQKLQYTLKEVFETKTVTARVYNGSFGAYTGVAWPQLPYDATLGYYTIKVRQTAADELTLLDYTGTEGENLALTFDTATGRLTQVNGTDPDGEGDFWVDCALLDGTYGGYYLTNADNSIQIADGHGTAALCGKDYDTWSSRYLFVEWYLDDRYADDPMIIKMTGSTPAQGRVDSLTHITVTFDRELTELRGLTPTLLDAYGNDAVDSLTATVNGANVDITLSQPVTVGGYYTLTLPQSFAAREESDNPGLTEKTTIVYQVGTPVADTLTWSRKAIDYLVDGWDDALFDEGGQFDSIQAEYYAVSRRLELRNFMGVEGRGLTVAFDAKGHIKALNGTAAADDFIGIYTYYPDYYWADFYVATDHYSLSEQDGYIILYAYFYKNASDEGTYGYYAITWDEETVTGIEPVQVRKPAGVYTLAGQKVSGRLRPGVYIVDGRKVVVR